MKTVLAYYLHNKKPKLSGYIVYIWEHCYNNSKVYILRLYNIWSGWKEIKNYLTWCFINDEDDTGDLEDNDDDDDDPFNKQHVYA
jgi:hypothetical protein